MVLGRAYNFWSHLSINILLKLWSSPSSSNNKLYPLLNSMMVLFHWLLYYPNILFLLILLVQYLQTYYYIYSIMIWSTYFDKWLILLVL